MTTAPPRSSTRKRVAIGLIVALGVAILYAAAPFVVGLLGGAALYVMVEPLHARLRVRLGTNGAAVVVLLAVVLLLLVPASWLLATVVEQAPDAIRSFGESAAFSRLSALRIGPFDVGEEILRASGTIASWMSGQALQIAGSAARALLNLLLAMFTLYYLLVSHDGAWTRFESYVPFSPRAVDQLRERFVSVTRATVLGIFTVGAAQGTIVGIGFALVGFDGAVFLAVLTAVASVLPVLGSALVWVPGVLVLVAQANYGGALLLGAIGGLLASNIDNVLRPLIYRRMSNVHPLVTLVGAFAGVRVFGLLGVLLGPLALEYFFELLQVYREEYGNDT